MRFAVCIALGASFAAFAAVAGPSVDATVRDASPERRAPAPARTRVDFARLPLFLVENRGQTDPRVVAYAKGRGVTLFFTKTGVTYAQVADGRRWAVKADFVGADAEVRTELRDATPTTVSYFKGPRAAWHAGLATFHEIVYRDLWPGVDAVWSADADRVECTYVVRPGADPSRIRLAYRGAASVATNAAGDLDVATPLAAFRDTRPVSYQETDGRRTPVRSAFVLTPGAAPGERICSFRVGAFDASRPLVIDPTTVVYAGYVGPAGDAQGNGIAVDSVGNAYVTGATSADETTFPVAAGPDLTYDGGASDAFVAKIATDGTGLVWAGYIGGDAADVGIAVALDSSRNVYVAGQTLSTQPSFPATVGPDLTQNGGQDGFVAKVAADGRSLVYAGFIGGAGDLDTATGVAVDETGAAYVAGFTSSDESTFPVKVGPELTYKGGTQDGFIAKVKPDGSGLVYAGYVGGSGTEFVHAVAVDQNHAAYVVGETSTADGTFPTKVGPDTSFNGDEDGFIVKVKADGSGFVYAGFIGGDGQEFVNGVVVDAQGRAYVVGATNSSVGTFPVVVGPSLTMQGMNDAYVGRIKADGAGFDWCGFLGGTGSEIGFGIALDAANDVFVTGETSSSETTFPVLDGPKLTFGGGFQDAFVAKVKSNGTALLYAGFLGGSGGHDAGYAIAVDGADEAYVVGVTNSTQTTFPVSVGPGLVFGGSGDAVFVAKVGAPPPPPPTTTVVESYVLPTKATAKFVAAHPEKSTLAVAGFIDTGPGAVDLTQPATLVVGGIPQYVIPALVGSKNGKSFSYAAPGVLFTVTPAKSGSSHAAFTFKRTGDLAGLIVPTGDLAMRFTQGAVDAAGTVKLAAGKYASGKVRGALVAPAFYVAKATATLKGANQDSLALSVGFAANSVTPADAPTLSIYFGDAFAATVDTKRQSATSAKFVFSGRGPGITSAVIDYAKGTISVSGKSMSLGAFSDGPQPVFVSVGFGAAVGVDAPAVRVRMAKAGKRLAY
jgi:hypothetical protein